ncbi:MAG: hypothetical protein WEC73_06565 [Chthoniobacterales bacterium]
MTTSGWIIMALSVGGTSGLFLWCIARVLRRPDKTEKLHGVLDTELKIEEEERQRRREERARD